MGHRPRWYLPEVLYDVTLRTLHGCFWLRPDPQCRAIVLGVFGKALRRYRGVRLHAFDAQSNHLHYLVSASIPAQLPRFFDYVHSNIARQINALRGRTGVFWSRRGMVIAVLDDEAQIDRLAYILSQGPKSGLVASPKDWPGACSTPALLGDMRLPAQYTSLDARHRNNRRARPRPETELAEDVAIELAPLPAFAALTPAQLRERHAALVTEIEVAHAGRPVLGVRRLVRQDPDAQPASFRRSPAPRCHARCPRVRRRFLACYRAFHDDYRRASQRALAGDQPLAVFDAYPPGAMIRSHLYRPAPPNLTDLWLRGHDEADAFKVRT